ncbi:1-acyl-sn-glycerol-3-phosphate acyltransferase [Patescibacteria group bacterium]|nr:1-acyl-sn-glycerol-3-phosphate acyltransferase [Patescibacteria group bacterium]
MAFPILRHTLFPLFRWRFRTTGLENLPAKPPFLIVSNHTSYLDAPMLSTVLITHINVRPYFLTHGHIADSFGKSISYNWLGMIPVYKDRKAESLLIAEQVLKDEGVVGIFPEGTRNYNQGNLLKGKTGTARLAHKTGIQIVPVGIIAPPCKTTSQSLKAFFLTGQNLEVVIGSPIQVNQIDDHEITKEILDTTTRQIMKSIGALCNKNYPY